MKFEPQYVPEECASKDETRAHLTSPYLDKAKERLVATDGHMLVAIPVKVEAGDVGGPIPSAALREARRRAVKPHPWASKKQKDDGLPRLRVGKRLIDTGGAIYRRPAPSSSFPDYAAVIPTWSAGEVGTVTFGVNPKLLLAVAKAIGAGTRMPFLRVTFEIPKDGEENVSPFLVSSEATEAIAVVMPARTGVKHNSKLAKKDKAA